MGMPSKQTAKLDAMDDVSRAARAIAALRERAGVTQRQVAEAHEDEISYQYVGQHETGKVPGIVKPATQRKMLAAISKAAKLEHPLTLEDLADEMAPTNGVAEDPRAFRMGQALLGGARRPTDRQAVFPTTAGEVVISFPADMDAAGFRELEAYLAVFLKARTQDS